jgi:uncharacterized protein (DUF2267 family)
MLDSLERDLVQRVKDRAGARTSREAQGICAAVLGALGGALEPVDAEALVQALPDVAVRSRASTREALDGWEALVDEVARRERVGRGFALEHAQVVLEALASFLEPAVLARIERSLPRDVAGWMRKPELPDDAPPHVHRHPGHGEHSLQTLSRSRPGASETIAEAHGALAHTGSVARSRSAHGERRIGSASSSRPGREDETLASSRGPERRK